MATAAPNYPTAPLRQPLPERAVTLAQELLAAVKANQRDAERDQAQKIARMMDDQRGKVLTMFILCTA